MLCHQCGALINDGAEVCDNCGYRFDSVAEDDINVKEEIKPAVDGEKVPALRTIEEEFASATKKADANTIVKVLSVVGAVLCFVLFFIAANIVGSVSIAPQAQSFMGGFFSTGTTGLPIEFYMSLRYCFFGLGTALSMMLLIQGFKKN